MKNIHVLPTDKPSRLFKHNNAFFIDKEFYESTPRVISQNIYITSDEEIKDCYVINTKTNNIYFENWYSPTPFIKKIILTTDQDLIKDGVQAIDDEFLEWFVKNPGCESVEVVYEPINFFNTEKGWEYTIIIPKEEHKPILGVDYEFSIDDDGLVTEIPIDKQETLEEASERMEILQKIDCDKMRLYFDGGSYSLGFNNGAEWQQEQDKNKFSEEDLMESFIEGYKQRAEKSDLIFDNASRMYAIALFEQYRNN
jgi:hypothetical protein